MADPFLAEIRVVPYTFAPVGWAFCNGQILAISQNTALFALLGTMYGGDGKSTFALPNLQGLSVVQTGQGAGLSDYEQGATYGTQTVTLLDSEMPVHAHGAQGVTDPADLQAPAPDRALARSSSGFAWQSDSASNLVQMAPQALAIAGGDLPHNNMPPFLTLQFIIALQGIFPPRG